jgi:hypothetical protein
MVVAATPLPGGAVAGVSFNPSIITPLIVNHPADWAV